MKRITGNIGVLPLPNGKFAFGRVIAHSNVEFYQYIGEREDDLPQDWDVRFTVCCHVSFFRHMKLVGKRAFASEEEKLPPAKYIYDVIGNSYSIYTPQGEIIPADPERCRGLERASVWEYEHIIDRIMGTGRYPSLILDHDLSED